MLRHAHQHERRTSFAMVAHLNVSGHLNWKAVLNVTVCLHFPPPLPEPVATHSLGNVSTSTFPLE